MMQPRLVIFDVDGTLVDSQAHIQAAMARAFQGLGLVPPPRAEVLAIVGLSLPQAMAQLAPDATADQQAALVEGYKAAWVALREAGAAEAAAPLYPHVAEVLASLHKRASLLMAVATGKSARGLQAFLAAHDLAGRFISAQCADHHPSKPHPSMIQACLADAGVAPESAVMVGDTRFDMDMAAAAGIPALAVDWGYHPVSALRAAGAVAVLSDFRELPDHLERIWGQVP